MYRWTPRGARPTFFRARCAEARKGGNQGYFGAGWHLGLHTVRQACEEAPVDVLEHACDQLDLDAVIAWYREWLPRCLALVPRRRLRQFAKGVVHVYLVRGIGNGGGDMTRGEADELLRTM